MIIQMIFIILNMLGVQLLRMNCMKLLIFQVFNARPSMGLACFPNILGYSCKGVNAGIIPNIDGLAIGCCAYLAQQNQHVGPPGFEPHDCVRLFTLLDTDSSLGP